MSWNKRLDSCFPSNKTTTPSSSLSKNVNQYIPIQVIPKAVMEGEITLESSNTSLNKATYSLNNLEQLSDIQDPVKLVSSIVSDPKNYNSIFVSERSGRVRRVDSDLNMSDIFSMEIGTDLAKSLQFTGPILKENKITDDAVDDKRGLLGVEIDILDPEWMWVTYTAHPDIQTLQFKDFEISGNHPAPNNHSINSQLFLTKVQEWALGTLKAPFLIDLVGKSHAHTVEVSENNLKEILHTANRSDFKINLESSKTNNHSHTVTIAFSPEQYDCFVCLARIKIPAHPSSATSKPPSSTATEPPSSSSSSVAPITLITPIMYKIIAKYKVFKFNKEEIASTLAITPLDYEKSDQERWLYWGLGSDSSTSLATASSLGKIWRVDLKTLKIEDAPYITGVKNPKSICFDIPSPVIYFSAKNPSSSASPSIAEEGIMATPTPPPRLAWTKGLYFTDSGGKWEEVNYSEKRGDAGWPLHEGPSRAATSSSSPSSFLINAVGYFRLFQEENDETSPRITIVGGRVYRNWDDALSPFLAQTPSTDPLHGYYVVLLNDGTLMVANTKYISREFVDGAKSLQVLPLESNDALGTFLCIGQQSDGTILIGTDYGIAQFEVNTTNSTPSSNISTNLETTASETSQDVTREGASHRRSERMLISDNDAAKVLDGGPSLPTNEENEKMTIPQISKAPNDFSFDNLLRLSSIDPWFNPYGNTPSPNYYPGSPYYPGVPYYPPYYPPQYDPNYPYYPPYVPPVPTDTLPRRCVDPSKCCVRAFITQASKTEDPSYQNRRMQRWEYEGHTVREEDLMYLEDWVNSGETKTSFTFYLNLFPSDYSTRNRGYYPDYPYGSNYSYNFNNNIYVYGGGHTHSIPIGQYHIDKLRRGESATFRTSPNAQFSHVHEVMLTCGQNPSIPIY